MTKQRKGAILAGSAGGIFVLLQLVLDLQTGLAGLFILGMASGLLLGGEMARNAKP